MVALTLAAWAAAACSDKALPVVPGTLAIHSTAASHARAVVLRVTGPVTGVSAPAGAYTVYSDSLAGDTTMIMVVAPAGTTLGVGALAILTVPNVNTPGRYGVTVLQASGADNALLTGGGGLSLVVGAP